MSLNECSGRLADSTAIDPMSPRGRRPVKGEPLAENNGGSALCISPSGRLGDRVP